MRFDNVVIPLAWSSPFARWQGALAETNSGDLAVAVTRAALAAARADQPDLVGVVFGSTTPQPGSFYAAPTFAARIGHPGITGPHISQACATSVAAIEHAALEVEQSEIPTVMLVCVTDRISNSPLLVYPSKLRGGAPVTEHWFSDNIAIDPWAQSSMLDTAEAVVEEAGFSREELDELVLMRHEQYQAARRQRKLKLTEVLLPKVELAEDEGIHNTTEEGLRKLAPVLPGGQITHAMQTHPADGSAGCLVAGRRHPLAGAGSARLLATGFARADRARMPKAPVPAAERALADAGLTIKAVDMVTTHNPFAVNDLWFSQQTGFPADRMNPTGCSLVYGHPQGPTGARAIHELINALVERGGGVGLFTGCAAGDTAGAAVIRVG